MSQVKKLPKMAREELIVKPIRKIYEDEGPEIANIYLNEFRARIREFERNQKSETPQGQVYKDLNKNRANIEEKN